MQRRWANSRAGGEERNPVPSHLKKHEWVPKFGLFSKSKRPSSSYDGLNATTAENHSILASHAPRDSLMTSAWLGLAVSAALTFSPPNPKNCSSGPRLNDSLGGREALLDGSKETRTKVRQGYQ